MQKIENQRTFFFVFFPLYFGSGLEKFSGPVRCDTYDSVDLAISAYANAVNNDFKNELNCFRQLNLLSSLIPPKFCHRTWKIFCTGLQVRCDSVDLAISGTANTKDNVYRNELDGFGYPTIIPYPPLYVSSGHEQFSVF